MASNYDGKVVISTALDNSGVEKDARKMAEVLEAEYQKAGKRASEALNKALEDTKHTNESVLEQTNPKVNSKELAKPQPVATEPAIPVNADKVVQFSGESAKSASKAEAAANRAVEAAQNATKASSQTSKSLNQTTQAVADAAGATNTQAEKIKQILSDTERSAKSKAASIAAIYKKQGLDGSTAMQKAWEQIERNTDASSKSAGEKIERNFGESTQAICGKLGGLTTVALKVCASIAAAFAGAMIAVTKMAVDAFAEYEQLTGGVETLFKGSASKVIGYAEDAFYTVGVSANEYMAMVTSFSASLIKSLGGDTEKAADVANMALIDMSDNANKMGTEMGLIQNAYQGFAKQNYTMLDNLKLGYGGTKTEMERLLKDAEALTKKKYDINNLADVYNAIHAIQEKLGIAGTTANEAERTISGSAAMTAAAWKNVLIAISSEGDLDKAINNLVFSVSRYFENIVPVVQRSIAGIGDLIEGVAPSLVQNVAKALIEAIPSLLNALYQMIIGLAKGIYQGIVALFTGGGKASVSLGEQMGGVADATNEAAQAEENLADGITSAGKAAKKYLAGFDEITKLNDAAGGGGTADVGGFVGGGGGFDVAVDQGQAEDVLSPFVQGIKDKILELVAPLKEIDFSKSIESAKKMVGAWLEIAKTIADHLEWYWFNILVPMAEWSIEELLPAEINLMAEALTLLNTVLQPVSEGLRDFYGYIEPVVDFIKETAVFYVNELAEAFRILSDKLKEKSPKIRRIISNLGSIFRKLWKAVEPVLGLLKDYIGEVFTHMAEVCGENLGILVDVLDGIIVFVDGVLSGDWEQAWSGIEEIFSAFVDSLFLRADEILGFLEPIFGDIDLSAEDAFNNIVTAVSDCYDEIKEYFAPADEWFSELFGAIEQAADGDFSGISRIAGECWSNIKKALSPVKKWFDENVAGPVSKAAGEAWSGLATAASTAWENVKKVFAPVKKYFEDTFVKGFKEAFKGFSDGSLFTDIKDGIAETFKSIVNQLIRGINNLLSNSFSNINSMINKLKGATILGYQPFKGLSTITIPQIPYLAQGAVLPPNKPFMAMVGDQRHGTNIEAPLATIEEAVANVMEDWVQSNVAGQEAVIAVLRDILQAVLGINIGDDEIGQAVARYNAKMAIIKGGAW